MYVVFVDDGFDSVYETKEEAKAVATSIRTYDGVRARIKKLTKKDKQMLGIED